MPARTARSAAGPAAVTPRAAPARPPEVARPFDAPLRGACACGGRCPRCQGGAAVSRPGSAPEAEADRIARRLSPHDAPADASVHHGTPLPTALRRHYEPRFGRPLGHLRLHSGPAAQAAAASLQAHAFTHDGHIVLGRGRSPQPGYTMAHEIAHALLHDPGTVWREPYETRGVTMPRADLDAMSPRGYWLQRTTRAYFVTTDTRMSSDPEERDAVLSVVWQLRPTPTVARRDEQLVPIAPRALPPPAAAGSGTAGAPAAPTQTPTTIYRIVFEPPATGDPRPRLTLEHVFSGTGTAAAMTPVAVPAAPARYTPPEGFRWNATNFDPTAHFSTRPAEFAALLHWIQTTAPATFSQLVTLQSTGARGAVHRTTLQVSGSHSGDDITSVTYTLVAEAGLAATVTAPADYRSHGDAGDADLEPLRTRSSNPLGTVTLPASTPADEVVPVKAYVAAHFGLHDLHATELDMLVPIGTGSRSVMYTATFDADRNVVLTRIGEVGTGAGMTDIRRLSVQRARGFPGTGDATALRSFWTTRYAGAPALTAAADAAPAAVLGEMDSLLAAGVAGAGWFQTVYGIEAMTGTATATRLDTAHHVPAAMRADTIDFTTLDLQMLELALQTLAPSELARLRGLKIGRKTQSITRSGGSFARGGENQYGLTLRDGSDTTVLYFGPLYLNDGALFRGSTAAGALPDVVMNVLHELGHASGYAGGLEAAFTAWLDARRGEVRTELQAIRAKRPVSQPDVAAAEARGAALAAPTWYAASGSDEMFPEVWALYHTDPHFLCGHAPLIHAWLDTLATSGSPPAATTTVTAPTSCPA